MAPPRTALAAWDEARRRSQFIHSPVRYFGWDVTEELDAIINQPRFAAKDVVRLMVGRPASFSISVKESSCRPVVSFKMPLRLAFN
jgi:hypothetical protein